MANKILTIPNILTIARLILLVPFAVIALDNPFLGAIIVAILGFTDFLDGWIARTFNQESELGRLLDPISDRTLFVVSFVVFTITETIPLWYVAIIGLREVIIVIGTTFVVAKKQTRLDVTIYGKISAFAAMAATPAWVLTHETAGSVHTSWAVFALICTSVAIPTGYYSIGEYVRAYKKA